MYGALLYGGKLIVISRMSARDPRLYLEILKKGKVTVLNQTPSAFYHLITEELKYEESELKLRCVIFGGEALNPARLKKWREKYPQVQLINMYGITETTVHVTYKEIKEKEIESTRSTIGKPIPTLSALVMDKDLHLLPPGVAGELCVGGKGVARGYLNRPALTREKFVKNPYKPKELLYRSGDLVRMVDMTGDMEYLGRTDHQVKIRGFRIEPGEIESLLLELEYVKEAVVLAKETPPGAHPVKDDNPTADTHLCAYLVVEGELGLSQLREHLSQQLPDYMIPSTFVKLGKIPLTPNGKVDRKTLDANGKRLHLSVAYTAPRNEMEKKIAGVWKEVLHVDRVGTHDNYFEMGGTSLDIIKINRRLEEIFQINVPVVAMFMHTTVHSLANFLLQETDELHDRSAELKRGKRDKMQQLQKRKGSRNE
jgi:acyl-CoA synthetase (AMP-forming)/AMP-acid ligase II